LPFCAAVNDSLNVKHSSNQIIPIAVTFKEFVDGTGNVVVHIKNITVSNHAINATDQKYPKHEHICITV